MGYIIIIIIAIIIIAWVEKSTYNWKTVVKHLWKQIYALADQMVSDKSGSKAFNQLRMELYRSKIEIRGKLINAILDFINTEKDKSEEEETYGHGRYDFEFILALAKKSPEVFKLLKKSPYLKY